MLLPRKIRERTSYYLKLRRETAYDVQYVNTAVTYLSKFPVPKTGIGNIIQMMSGKKQNLIG